MLKSDNIAWKHIDVTVHIICLPLSSCESVIVQYASDDVVWTSKLPPVPR